MWIWQAGISMVLRSQRVHWRPGFDESKKIPSCSQTNKEKIEIGQLITSNFSAVFLPGNNYPDLHHLQGIWNLPHKFHLYLVHKMLFYFPIVSSTFQSVIAWRKFGWRIRRRIRKWFRTKLWRFGQIWIIFRTKIKIIVVKKCLQKSWW